MSQPNDPDAGAIAGLLADDDRRRCFAAVALDAASSDDVVVATGLSAARVGKALGRLVAAGLVVTRGDGLMVNDTAVRAAAREALSRPERVEHDHLPPTERKVMRAFVVDGRVTQIPASAGRRRILLEWLAQEFEPGRRYSEATVNLVLGQRHADTASLRRYLVDEGLLDREAGFYWRSGGPVPV